MPVTDPRRFARMDALDVVDWRRRVFATYAAVRADSDPASAHARWREDRDDLFAHHPATPLLPEHRAGFTGLTVAPYDAAWRFEVEVQTADPTQRTARTPRRRPNNGVASDGFARATARRSNQIPAASS